MKKPTHSRLFSRGPLLRTCSFSSGCLLSGNISPQPSLSVSLDLSTTDCSSFPMSPLFDSSFEQSFSPVFCQSSQNESPSHHPHRSSLSDERARLKRSRSRSTTPVEFNIRVSNECDKLIPQSTNVKKNAVITLDQYENLIGNPNQKVITIDSRYPFEYECGHVIGAINITDDFSILESLKPFEAPRDGIKPVLVIYCEFSKTRGPKIAKKIRELECNRMYGNNEFEWHFPEIYILEGGFSAIFETKKHLCVGDYVKMKSPRYATEHTVSLKKLHRSSISLNNGMEEC